MLLSYQSGSSSSLSSARRVIVNTPPAPNRHPGRPVPHHPPCHQLTETSIPLPAPTGVQALLYLIFGNTMVAFSFFLSCCFQSSKTAVIFAYLYVLAAGLIGSLLLQVRLTLPHFPTPSQLLQAVCMCESVQLPQLFYLLFNLLLLLTQYLGTLVLIQRCFWGPSSPTTTIATPHHTTYCDRT